MLHNVPIHGPEALIRNGNRSTQVLLLFKSKLKDLLIESIQQGVAVVHTLLKLLLVC